MDEYLWPTTIGLRSSWEDEELGWCHRMLGIVPLYCDISLQVRPSCPLETSEEV